MNIKCKIQFSNKRKSILKNAMCGTSYIGSSPAGGIFDRNVLETLT